MRMLALLVGLAVLLVSGSAQAASYRDIRGTVHDPIQNRDLGFADHLYAGPNLEPGVSAPGANLSSAYLSGADLSGADLSGAILTGAYLGLANLTDANFTGADLTGADMQDFTNLTGAIFADANLSGIYAGVTKLDGADFRGADLRGILFAYGIPGGVAIYDKNTNFMGASVQPLDIAPLDCPGAVHECDFDPVAAGWILVPEPTTGLLLGLGLLGVAFRRRSMR
jgi:hypothetical protein